MRDTLAAADLIAFINASPTPYHCAAEAERRLRVEGFSAVDPREPWTLAAGAGYFLRRGGLFVAWRRGNLAPHRAGFRLIGAHTDSPGLRLKPKPDLIRSGWQQLGVEVYGGALTYTWLDRDLGLAGRVMLRGEGTPRAPLVHVARPLLRIPSLAIHLDRTQRDKLELNDQKHLAPVLALAAPELLETGKQAGAQRELLRPLLAQELDVAPGDILGWDLLLCDVVPAARGGRDGELIFAPRLDNQGMCHAALAALLKSRAQDATQVVCLYDHEEAGSGSATGAQGAEVEHLLRRLSETDGPGVEAGSTPRAVARSLQVSADMAHAIHPNYSDRHEPEHQPRLNGGPVLKVNAQQRYATDGETAAVFSELCTQADVPVQHFVTRSDLPCGTTIGPIAAARLGIRTVDVGNPMLSMHSCRELAGAEDPAMMIEVLRCFLES